MDFFICSKNYLRLKMTKESFTAEDRKFMRMALMLAEKGRGTVSPNPMVGAVITKDNVFISGGFHAAAGYNHAEINAIENAVKKFGGRLPEGLKMYVTLEPCSIYGRTPPCTDAIISNKFSEIIISVLDPNPKINGEGAAKLKNAGIKVKTGLLQKEAEKLNEIFFTNITKNRPFICAKTASTLDGNLAAKTGDSKWVTDEKSRMLVQRLRFNYGCVLTGINTVIKDNPFLYPRKSADSNKMKIYEKDGFKNIEKTFLKKEIVVSGKDRKLEKIRYFNFKRAIIDSGLDIDTESNIVNTSKYIKTIIFTTAESIRNNKQKYNILSSKGVHIEAVNAAESISTAHIIQNSKKDNGPLGKNEIMLDLNDIMQILLKKHETTSVMLECGPGLLTSFLKEKLIDKFLFFIAPKLVGGNNSYCIFNDLGIDKMAESIKLKFDKIKKIQNDLLIEAYPCLQE